MEKETKLLSMKPCGRMVNSQVLDCSRLVAQQRSAVARAADQRLRRTSAALQARHVDDTKMIGHDGFGTNQRFLFLSYPSIPDDSAWDFRFQNNRWSFEMLMASSFLDIAILSKHHSPHIARHVLPWNCSCGRLELRGGGGWQSIDVEVWLKIIETWMFGTLNLSFVAVQAASLWCS